MTFDTPVPTVHDYRITVITILIRVIRGQIKLLSDVYSNSSWSMFLECAGLCFRIRL